MSALGAPLPRVRSSAAMPVRPRSVRGSTEATGLASRLRACFNTIKEVLAPVRAADAQRAEWVDVGKGICSVHMVLGHVVAGLMPLGVLSAQASWTTYYDWKYTFNMPVLFVLCGLFLSRGLEKGFGRFLDSRARTLLFPHLLWSVIFWGMLLLFAPLANSRYDLSFPVQIFYDPRAGMWTLATLFIASVGFALMRQWGVSAWTMVLIMAGVYAGSAVGMLDIIAGDAAGVIQHLSWFGGWLTLGAAAGPWLMSASSKYARAWMAPVGVAMLLVSLAVFLGIDLQGAARKGVVALLGVPGSLMLAAGLSKLGSTWFNRVLAQLGKHSLEIYMLSAFGMVGARLLMHRVLGIEHGGVLLAAGLISALVLPLVATHILQRLGMSFVFRLPMRKARTSIAQPARDVAFGDPITVRQAA